MNKDLLVLDAFVVLSALLYQFIVYCLMQIDFYVGHPGFAWACFGIDAVGCPVAVTTYIKYGRKL